VPRSMPMTTGACLLCISVAHGQLAQHRMKTARQDGPMPGKEHVASCLSCSSCSFPDPCTGTLAPIRPRPPPVSYAMGNQVLSVSTKRTKAGSLCPVKPTLRDSGRTALPLSQSSLPSPIVGRMPTSTVHRAKRALRLSNPQSPHELSRNPGWRQQQQSACGIMSCWSHTVWEDDPCPQSLRVQRGGARWAPSTRSWRRRPGA